MYGITYSLRDGCTYLQQIPLHYFGSERPRRGGMPRIPPNAASLIGRRIRPEMKYGANTIGSGPWLEVGKSRDPFTRL